MRDRKHIRDRGAHFNIDMTRVIGEEGRDPGHCRLAPVSPYATWRRGGAAQESAACQGERFEDLVHDVARRQMLRRVRAGD